MHYVVYHSCNSSIVQVNYWYIPTVTGPAFEALDACMYIQWTLLKSTIIIINMPFSQIFHYVYNLTSVRGPWTPV